jgi:hypothetical protein
LEKKKRIRELNDPQKADRTKMEEKDCIEYDEKLLLQDEVMDYKEVKLEGEIRQIQKTPKTQKEMKL